MSKQIHFFATKEDMLHIIRNIEENMELKYVKLDAYNTKDIKTYNSLAEFEDLGINISGEHLDNGFLVLERDEILNIDTVQLRAGGENYHINQKLNENSITIWLSGIHKNEYLVCGHMGTIHDSSKKLYDVFRKGIRKQCDKKIDSYFVGKEAIKLYGKLRFITINTNQSEEYDLKL